MDSSTLTALGVIASIILGLMSLGWQAYRERQKLPGEVKASNGQASESYATAARMTAEENIELKKRLAEAEERLNAIEENTRALKKLIEDQAQIILDLREWAERLCHQIQSLGAIPVTFIKKTNGTVVKDQPKPS